ncbi:MAG: hypothetical protein EZS28_015374 [Streblomastix strix]|uniref:Uncharacterized protein n=1 Tax=Streblomastix strix TaxID=222440 RepID=A0A5J4W3J3_9EUKA|nr:MAG: hypothetical protein EZS28_015374 [Streblomastix strix]
MAQTQQKYYGKTADGPEHSEHLKFWLGFSSACGPFNQFAILRDAQNLWNTAIYAREQAVICSNSLTDLCTNNSVSVSPLENIIAGKRHCGTFLDIPLSDIDRAAAGAIKIFYLIPYDITFSGVLDLNQLNPIFNSFPVLTRNFASLYLQLWVKATKTLYSNKYMLAWKMATDDSFTRGYNSSKTGARTNPHQVAFTPIMHYLCEAFVRITFDDNSDPQELSMDAIGGI